MRSIPGCVPVIILAATQVVWAGVLDLRIEPSVPGAVSAAVGDKLSFQVWLRNIAAGAPNVTIQSVELDFGQLPAGLRFVPGPGAADGFLENSPPVPSELDTVLDGSLLDTHSAGLPDLSYVAMFTPGIPSGTDRLLGAFWIEVQPGAVGPYTLSLDNSGTSIIAGNLSSFSVIYANAQIVVPEPGSLGVLLGLGALLRRRPLRSLARTDRRRTL